MRTFRRRIERLERRLIMCNAPGPKLPIYYWEPTDPESTRFVHEHHFNLPHPKRKFEVRIVGDPDNTVYDMLAQEHIPDPEVAKTLPAEELRACLDRYFEAAKKARNENRRKMGLPPV
jgi:hypothetical protein